MVWDEKKSERELLNKGPWTYAGRLVWRHTHRQKMNRKRIHWYCFQKKQRLVFFWRIDNQTNTQLFGSNANLRYTTTQCFCHGGHRTTMGRDPDSKWAHWLVLSRRDRPGSMLGTFSLNCFPSSPSKPSSNVGDSKPLLSRSNGTSYFALLSTNEHGSTDRRSSVNYKQHGNVSGLTTRDVDFRGWVAWFTERWRQRQFAEMPD